MREKNNYLGLLKILILVKNRTEYLQYNKCNIDISRSFVTTEGEGIPKGKPVFLLLFSFAVALYADLVLLFCECWKKNSA